MLMSAICPQPMVVKAEHFGIGFDYEEIQSWPKISAPLVNMIKEGCEN